MHIRPPNSTIPKTLNGGRDPDSLFLAGSISNAWDWQEVAANVLKHDYDVYNPRRENYKSFDPKVEREQIIWEYDRLKKCGTIIFWFSHETLAPITLFEYGKCLEWKKRGEIELYVGASPEYKRINDLLIQTELAVSKEFSETIKLDFKDFLYNIKISEFNPSLDMDAATLIGMPKQKVEDYLKELNKRRWIAHNNGW